MGKYKKLFSNTAVFGLSNALSKIVLSAMLPLYTRTLSADEYGLAETVVSVSQIVIPICSLAIQDAVFRFTMDKECRREDVLINGLSVVAMASVLIVLITNCLRKDTQIASVLSYFIIICLLSMLRSMLSLYTKAAEKTMIFSIDNFFYNFLLAIFNFFLLAICRQGLKGYFGSIIIADIISILFLLIKNDIIEVFLKGRLHFILLKKMVTYSFPLIINSISWGITNTADKIMISVMCSTSDVGIYSAASKIPSILSAVIGVFIQAWTLSAIQEYETGKDNKFYKNVFIIIHICTFIGTALILLMNNNIILWIIGGEYAESVKYSPVILLGTVFLMYSNFCSPIYSAMKKSKLIMASSVGGAVLNVVFNYLLISLIGVMGACIATAISYGYIALYRLIKLHNFLDLNIDMIRWLFSIILLIINIIFVVNNKYAIIITLTVMSINLVLYHKNITNLLKTLKVWTKNYLHTYEGGKK